MVGLFLSLLMAVVGLAIDVAWYQVNVDRMQRAADAAALAGVVYLPANASGARTAALNEAAKNGYTNGTGGVVVTAAAGAINNKILDVTVSGPVRTFFARLLGISIFNGSRDAHAEFILPVPMGSPQDYYGIYKLCDSTGSCSSVRDARESEDSLASQGFWGGVITRGGQHSNGDAYSPFFNGGSTQNTEYDANGYSYDVEIPRGVTNGAVWIFDATFCAVGHGSTGTYLGTGDHWIGPGGQPVTLQYRLWDTLATPYTTADDVLVTDSGSTFFNLNQVDKGSRFRGDGNYADGAGYGGGTSADCQSDPYHNRWYRLASGLGEGTYRIQVTTSDPSNSNTSAENMFGLEVTGSGNERVYGQSRMVAYANVASGSSVFYLAQVDPVHAGKTLEIRLFDPGDVGGDATLRIKRPTPTGYVYATFSFAANGGTGPQSGSNVTLLQTASGGSTLYNNAWVTISIPLPTNYGQGGLTPPGETEPGWWKIEYQITAAGNDTTTWEVNIRGNPVHLVLQ